jgi:hypothetical protein
VLTKRVIKWLGDEAKNNPMDYQDFYEQFGYKVSPFPSRVGCSCFTPETQGIPVPSF